MFSVYGLCSGGFVFVDTFICYYVCYFVASDASVGSDFVDGNFVWGQVYLVNHWCYE